MTPSRTPSRTPAADFRRPGNFRRQHAISPPPAAIPSRNHYARMRAYTHARETANPEEVGVSERGVTIAVRGPDGKARKVGPTREAQSIRDTASERWAAAPTPLKRWAAAFDYARAAAAAVGRGGLDSEPEIERATRDLWALGDAFTAWLAQQGSDDG